MLELAWGACTDRGHRRSHNEDAWRATPPVFAVADGMGGHHRGDLASEMAIESFTGLDGRPTRTAVLEQVRRSHLAIADYAARCGEGSMGTTLCGLAVTSEAPDDALDTLLAFNVGDSRIYLVRDGAMTQLSHDHSVVQELIDEGTITLDQAATHPERHVVTRSLGGIERPQIDWWPLRPLVGDRFLLCSDGLVRELTTEQIVTVLTRPAPPQVTADDLVAATLARDARDNVTVVVVDVVATAATGSDRGEDTRPRSGFAAIIHAGPRPGSAHPGSPT